MMRLSNIGKRIAGWYGKDYVLLPRWFKTLMFHVFNVYHLEIQLEHIEYPERRIFKHMGEWWCQTTWSRSRPSHTRKLATNWSVDVVSPEEIKAYGEELRKIWRAPL